MSLNMHINNCKFLASAILFAALACAASLFKTKVISTWFEGQMVYPR